MKHFKLLLFMLLPMLLAVSCKTITYQSRSIDILRDDARQQTLKAELKVDLTHKVSAVSDMQESKKDAIISAYYKCILDNKIDVVVDPIVKITVYPVGTSKFEKNAENSKSWVVQYKAEILGFAGKYENVEKEEELVKKYDNIDMNSIIKYKMVNDPDFYKSYYNNQKTNNVIVNPQAKAPAKNSSSTETSTGLVNILKTSKSTKKSNK